MHAILASVFGLVILSFSHPTAITHFPVITNLDFSFNLVDTGGLFLYNQVHMHMAVDPQDSDPKTAPHAIDEGLFIGKKPLIALVIIVGILLLGGSYRLGSKKGGAVQPSPTPAPSLQPTATPAPLGGGQKTPKATPVASPTTTKPTPAASPGASPVPTPTPTSQTKTISSTAALDGFRSSNGGGNAGVDIRAGRNVNLVTRGFVSFDLAAVPTGATIENATLRLYQSSVQGDPYGVGSRIMADHLDYGDVLENTDYGAASLSTSFAILSTTATVEWKEADVTDAVRNDLTNNRTRSQYRLHFAIETQGGNVAGDFAYFESGENYSGTGKTPQLVVKYN